MASSGDLRSAIRRSAILVLAAATSIAGARSNHTYYMEGSRCGTEAAVDGVTVFSHSPRSALRPSAAAYSHNTECQIGFRARREGWRMMLHFDYVDIPDRTSGGLCNDALYVYDSNAAGSRAVKAAGGNAGLCADVPPPTIFSTGRYLTVYFRTDNGGRQGRGFRFTVTAFGEGNSCGSLSFRCKDDRCIEEELLCDGIRHCADGSDEADISADGRCSWTQSTVAADQETLEQAANTIWDDFLDLGVAACVGIVGGAVVVLVLVVVCIACTCRRCLSKDGDQQPRQSTANNSNAGLLLPLPAQAAANATPVYKHVPWVGGVGQPQPLHSNNPYGTQGYFPLTQHGGSYVPPTGQQQSQQETIFSPHLHRESYSMPSGSYGTPRSAGGSSAFAQPMHTRPTGPGGPRSYTPTTTVSSRSGSSSAAYPCGGGSHTPSQL